MKRIAIVRKIFYYSMCHLACVTMRSKMPLLSLAVRKPGSDNSSKDQNYIETGVHSVNSTCVHTEVKVAVMTSMAKKGWWGGKG